LYKWYNAKYWWYASVLCHCFLAAELVRATLFYSRESQLGCQKDAIGYKATTMWQDWIIMVNTMTAPLTKEAQAGADVPAKDTAPSPAALAAYNDAVVAYRDEIAASSQPQWGMEHGGLVRS
jgi:hypothetical protein